MLWIAFFVITLSVIGCSNTENIPQGKSLLQGENSDDIRVLIRSIDDGEILWTSQTNYTLSPIAIIDPGQRKIDVVCEFYHNVVTEMLPSSKELTIKANMVYHIKGYPSETRSHCNLSINEYPFK